MGEFLNIQIILIIISLKTEQFFTCEHVVRGEKRSSFADKHGISPVEQSVGNNVFDKFQILQLNAEHRLTSFSNSALQSLTKPYIDSLLSYDECLNISLKKLKIFPNSPIDRKIPSKF